MEVLRLRQEELTQDEVAKVLGTSRENVSIVERNAYNAIRVAKSTVKAYESLQADNIVAIPERTPVYDIPRMVLARADMLGIKVRVSEHDMLAMLESGARIRNHHLTHPLTVELPQDGKLLPRHIGSSNHSSSHPARETTNIFGNQ